MSKCIGNNLFKDIVKISYEMKRAEEQENAFHNLLEYAEEVREASKFKKTIHDTVDAVLFGGETSSYGMSIKWGEREYDALFDFFLLRYGAEECAKMNQDNGWCDHEYLQEHPDTIRTWIHNGIVMCKIETTMSVLSHKGYL